MSDDDLYYHTLVLAVDRIAEAVRTEDPAVIGHEIARALAVPHPQPTSRNCSCAVPRLDPAVAYAVITAAASQIDTATPVRERNSWTLDIEVLRSTGGAR